jgi:hypothetical protein
MAAGVTEDRLQWSPKKEVTTVKQGDGRTWGLEATWLLSDSKAVSSTRVSLSSMWGTLIGTAYSKVSIPELVSLESQLTVHTRP